MSWLILFIAGLLEVVWAVGLKYTHGFSRLVPSVITIAAMVISMALLSWAMKTLPVGDGLRRLDRNWRGRRSRDGDYPARRIRQPDAHCQPGVYCGWYHWPENERALILLIDPQQFADVESLPGSDIQHLLLHFWRDFRRARQ